MKNLGNVFKALGWLGLSCMFFYAANALAQGGSSQDIGSIAGNIKQTFGALAQLVTAVSYVAGMGFGIASILKFKAHKDNPTQIPIGTPIALLFVAAALLFMPTLFGVAGQTVFGSGKSAGGVSGISDIS
jgi:intracellular multiplication protein IcmD